MNIPWDCTWIRERMNTGSWGSSQPPAYSEQLPCINVTTNHEHRDSLQIEQKPKYKWKLVGVGEGMHRGISY
jgi:hypothetical protein